MPKSRVYGCLLGVVVSLIALSQVLAQQGGSVDDAVAPIDCVIYPSAVADVGAAAPGILAETPVDRSDTVNQGDVLAVLESGAERAAVVLDRARMKSTAQIDYHTERVDYTDKQLSRAQQLYKKNVLAIKDRDDLSSEVRLEKIQLRQAIENREFLTLELAHAEELLKRRTVRSPFTGVVIERYKSAGEFIDDQPLLRVAQLHPLHIEAIIPASEIGNIKPGLQADIWSETGSGGQWLATVDRVDSVVDVASGTFGVRLVLPNPEYKVTAGIHCKLRFGQFVAPTVEPPAVTQANVESHAMALAVKEELFADSGGRVDEEVQPDIASAVAGEELPSLECPEPQTYGSKSQAQLTVDQWAEKGVPVDIVEQNVTEASGFVVKSAILQTQAEVEEVSRLLQAGNMLDFHRPGNSVPVQISLGAFSDSDAAERRIVALEALGIDTVKEPWMRETSRYRLKLADEVLSATLGCD